MFFAGLFEFLLVPALIILATIIFGIYAKLAIKSAKRSNEKRRKAYEAQIEQRKFLERQLQNGEEELRDEMMADIHDAYAKEKELQVKSFLSRAHVSVLTIVNSCLRFLAIVTGLWGIGIVIASMALAVSVITVATVVSSNPSSGGGGAKTEQTSKTYDKMTSTGPLEGTIEERAIAVAKMIRKYYPDATIDGISGFAGNFAAESGIEPMRAEGDYLQPPVGKYEGSFDDEKWLEMGNEEIYGGIYPRIVNRGIGLGQWTDTQEYVGGEISPRATNLRKYAEDKGVKWYTLEVQIDYMINHDGGNSEIAKDILRSTSGAGEAARRAMQEWERVGDNTLGKRISEAERLKPIIEEALKE